jgi:rare lipoprotein A
MQMLMMLTPRSACLRWAGAACLLMLALLVGCSSTPNSSASGHSDTGQASYYGNEFHGRKTANGERFDQGKLTAAHRSLPFGTRVKVTNTQNGKTVVVRVNDRGPFVKGRIIDLSSSAFKSIASLNAGVVPVRIQVMD